jgi:hypothetical protein
MTIVLQIPDRLKGLIQSIQSAIQTSSQLVDQFSQGDRIDYASIETLLAQQAAGIERATHQAFLEAFDIDAPLIKVGDVVHTRVGRYPGTAEARLVVHC